MMPLACLPRKRSDRGALNVCFLFLLLIYPCIAPLAGQAAPLGLNYIPGTPRKLFPNRWRLTVTVYHPNHQTQPSNAVKRPAANDGKTEFTFVCLPPPSCVTIACPHWIAKQDTVGVGEHARRSPKAFGWLQVCAFHPLQPWFFAYFFMKEKVRT